MGQAVRRQRRSPPGRTRFLNDPFRTLANWAIRRYHLGRVDIQFVPGHRGLGFAGRTTFQQGRVPYIELNASTKLDELLGVLAHEMAHVFRYRNRRRWKHWGRHDRAFWKLNQTIQYEWTAYCNKGPGKRKRSGKR